MTSYLVTDDGKRIITDGGDFTNWEWKYGEGLVYPPELVDPKADIPELDEPEGLAIQPYPLLPIEQRPLGVQSDQNCNHGNEGRR